MCGPDLSSPRFTTPFRDAESQTILKLEIFFLAGSLSRQLEIFFSYHSFKMKLEIFFSYHSFEMKLEIFFSNHSFKLKLEILFSYHKFHFENRNIFSVFSSQSIISKYFSCLKTIIVRDFGS